MRGNCFGRNNKPPETCRDYFQFFSLFGKVAMAILWLPLVGETMELPFPALDGLGSRR